MTNEKCLWWWVSCDFPKMKETTYVKIPFKEMSIERSKFDAVKETTEGNDEVKLYLNDV